MNKSILWAAGALLCLVLGIQGCNRAPEPAAAPLRIQTLANPASDKSQAPNIAVGTDGAIVMSWIEDSEEGNALRYAEFSAGAFGAARTVVSGENWFVNWADFPSVVPVNGSLWAAHWLERRAAGGYAYGIRAAVSADSGDTWSEPFTPHTDDTDTEHGFVTIYPDGTGIGMLWLDGRKMVNEYDENDVASSGMTLRAATFGRDRQASNETLVDDLTCDCCQTDVAMTARGPVAVYRDRTVNEIRDIFLARRIDGEWQPGIAVGADEWEIPGCPVNGPIVQSSADRLAVAWFTAAREQPKVQVAWSEDSGASFGNPVVVASGDLLGHVGATMLPDGGMVVAWLASGTGDGASLHLRRVAADGSAGPDTPIAEAAGIAAFSVPQIAATGSGLLLAWTAASGAAKRVHTALVPLALLD